MKRLLAVFALGAVAASLTGCYYDPGYSYVRQTGYAGDAYYGRAAPAYDDTYYGAPGYDDGYYGDGYYGGYYGCCYAPGVSVGISSGWYGGSRHYRDRDDGYRDRDGDHRRDYRGHAGQWQSRSAPDNRSRGGDAPSRGGSRHGDRGRGDRDHRH